MHRSVIALSCVVVMTLALMPTAATAQDGPPGSFVLGLGTDAGGGVLVADAAQGVTLPDGTLLVGLANVSDVAASDQGWWWVITGGGDQPTDAMLFRAWPDGTYQPFADLGAYEARYNPHPTAVDSNPFSVVDGGRGEAVVADAAGNTLLKVDKHGKVKLIAVLPDELVPTADAKSLVEEIVSNLSGEPVTCGTLPPDAPPEGVQICELPDMLPAEAVATSVAIGPDGDYYVGELKGFPAPTGESQVWRIRRNARNADCSRSPLCTVAHDGFTSIVDLAFDGPTLHVAELDAKSWFAFELGVFEGLPLDLGLGTVSACTPACTPVVSDVFGLSAITVDGADQLWYASIFGPVVAAP